MDRVAEAPGSNCHAIVFDRSPITRIRIWSVISRQSGSSVEAGHSLCSMQVLPLLPLLPGSEQPSWAALHDLAFLLASEAGALAGRLSSVTATAVGDLVRGMNCYHSNLIEGHDTRPVDIERALRADLATEPRRRDLQMEAAAHIAVQAAIDAGELDGFGALSALKMEIHRRRACWMGEGFSRMGAWQNSAASSGRPAWIRSVSCAPCCLQRHFPTVCGSSWRRRQQGAGWMPALHRFSNAPFFSETSPAPRFLPWSAPATIRRGAWCSLWSHAAAGRCQGCAASHSLSSWRNGAAVSTSLGAIECRRCDGSPA